MKALVIKIRDAGIFKDPRISKSHDKVMDREGYVSRFDKRKKTHVPYIKLFAGQLSIKHVANLLRVLFGQRPVPTLRKVSNLFTGDSYYEYLARRVRVKIESPVIKDRYTHYPEEFVTIRKSIGDSWQTATRAYFLDGEFIQVKGGLLYHDRLHRYLGNELYTQFNALIKAYGSCDTIQEAIELLNTHKTDLGVIAFCRSCKENKCASLSNIILNEHADSVSIHSSPRRASVLNVLMASGTIDTLEKFNATLYVPVTDNDLLMIDKHTGVATFLEGGFAKVERIEDWSELIELETVETVEGEYVCDKNT